MALSARKKSLLLSLVALLAMLVPGCDRGPGKSDLRPADGPFGMARAEGLPILPDPCSLISLAQVRRVLDVQDSGALRSNSTAYRCEFRVDREAGEGEVLSLAFQRLTGVPHRVEEPEALAARIGRALDWPQAPRYAGRLDGGFLFVSDAEERITRVLLTTPHQATAMEPNARLVIVAEMVNDAQSTACRLDQTPGYRRSGVASIFMHSDGVESSISVA